MTWRQKLRRITLILFPILYALCWAQIIYKAFIVAAPDPIHRFLSVDIAISHAAYPCIIAFILILLLNANANIKFSIRAREWREMLYIAAAWGILPVFRQIFAHLTL